jgi:hypothetical protein
MIQAMRRWAGRSHEWWVSTAVVAGTAVGLSLALLGHGTAPSIEKQAAGGTTSVTPQWLPPGTKLTFKGAALPAELLAPVFHRTPNSAGTLGGIQAEARQPPDLKGPGAGALYLLAGKANISPIAYYPVTGELLVTFSPGQYLSPTASSGQGVVVKNVTVGGFAGILTYPDPSLRPDAGSVQLEWADPQGLHSISSERGYTSSGMSGLSSAALLKVANSLYW